MSRLDAEWISINAIRGGLQIASRGDTKIGTYDKAIAFGAELLPELLGDESLIRKYREGPTAREFRQKAKLQSKQDDTDDIAIDLLKKEKVEFEGLYKTAKSRKLPNHEFDKIKTRLRLLIEAETELSRVGHTENQLIFRDAYNNDYRIPAKLKGKQFKDYVLPENRTLRVRVFHPDKQEHISGSDILYERHSIKSESVTIAAIQYKIWKNRCLKVTEARLSSQVEKLRNYLCNKGLCSGSDANSDNNYRFPFCSAFLRPTDYLQSPDQRLLSTGEHIPICKLNACLIKSEDPDWIYYDKIKDISVGGDAFQSLFNQGRIGSRPLTYDELEELHETVDVESHNDNLILHLQEFDSNSEAKGEIEDKHEYFDHSPTDYD